MQPFEHAWVLLKEMAEQVDAMQLDSEGRVPRLDITEEGAGKRAVQNDADIQRERYMDYLENAPPWAQHLYDDQSYDNNPSGPVSPESIDYWAKQGKYWHEGLQQFINPNEISSE